MSGRHLSAEDRPPRPFNVAGVFAALGNALRALADQMGGVG